MPPGGVWLTNALQAGSSVRKYAFGAATSDHRDGGRRAVEHLIALGQRIARVSFSGDPLAGRDRIDGGHDALAAAGLAEDPGLVAESGDWDAKGAYQATLRLLDRGLHFTAIAAGSDIMAINVIGALVDRGLSVPDDTSVAGFDDLPLSSMIRPMLTTIREDINAIGAAVVASMRQMLEHGHTPEPVIVPTALVVRGPPPLPAEPRRAGPDSLGAGRETGFADCTLPDP